jgi:hypothetical protein
MTMQCAGTIDLLKAAGLEPVPSHLEPDFVPQAMRSKLVSVNQMKQDRLVLCETSLD